MSILRIKNWQEFQHYKNRGPYWIKLHFRILSSKDWVNSSDSDRVLIIACMLVASQSKETDGRFEADPDYFQRVAYLEHKPNFKSLISNGFLETLEESIPSLYDLPIETEKRRDREELETEKDTRVRETTSNGGSLHFSGTRLKITSEEHKALSLAFEGADFGTEYFKMDSWLVTNRRNYRAFGRFANGWLSRQKLPNIGGQNGTSKHSDQQLRTIAAAKRALERRGIGGTDEVLTTLPPRTN